MFTNLQEALDYFQEEKLLQILNDIAKQKQELNLPSQFHHQQVVKLTFDPEHPLIATVRAVHFFIDKVKYDLDVWVGKGGNDSTRIYNVDSVFVEAA